MNLIHILHQLESLKFFLHAVSEVAGRDWDSIEKKRQAGNFAEYEDWDAASDRPFVLMDIAIRAIAYELVALTESELHHLANEPWLKLRKKNPRSFGPTELKQIKMVSDLKFEKVIELAEIRIGIRLEEVDGWAEIKNLRDVVNAFKHRRGMRRWRDIDPAKEGPFINLHHRISQEDITNIISAVARFSRHLQELIRKAPLNTAKT